MIRARDASHSYRRQLRKGMIKLRWIRDAVSASLASFVSASAVAGVGLSRRRSPPRKLSGTADDPGYKQLSISTLRIIKNHLLGWSARLELRSDFLKT
jgi:hypothetical protein